MSQIYFLTILKHKKVLSEIELSQVKKELMEEIAQPLEQLMLKLVFCQELMGLLCSQEEKLKL